MSIDQSFLTTYVRDDQFKKMRKEVTMNIRLVQLLVKLLKMRQDIKLGLIDYKHLLD